MNSYIILDGKKYSAIHQQWEPIVDRPVVVKKLLSGASNVTFGPANAKRWQGTVRASAVNPEAGYGTVDDLRTSCGKLAVLVYQDHYGVSHNVVVDRTVGERSISPVWDGASNKFHINITLVEV